MDSHHDILAPSQRHTVVEIEDFVRSGQSAATLYAQRGCGTTALFQSLVQYQGFGNLPIEFIYRSVRTTDLPATSLPGNLNRLSHRVVFLLDRATETSSIARLADQSDQIQWIKAESPTRFSASSTTHYQLRLSPLSEDQIRQFIEARQFTICGRLIQISDETIRHLAQQSGGRLRKLAPLIEAELERRQSVIHGNRQRRAA